MSQVVLAFDLYGTLMSTESISKALATHFGQEKADSIAAVWRKYQLEYTWRLNSMRLYLPFSEVTRRSFHHALLEHKLTLSEEDSNEMVKGFDSLSTFPDVESALKKLANNSNFKCVVFSNGTRAMINSLVYKSADLAPLSSVFQGIVTVDDVSKFKPTPETYDHFAQSVDRVGHEKTLWLISGNPFDVSGARAMGWNAAWVDRKGTGWQDRLSLEPTLIVKSLEDLPDAIEKYVRHFG